MQRRSALKQVALAMGSVLSLPAWASNWTPESIGRSTFTSAPSEQLLADVVEAIIPEGKTPGAKSLGVQQYILRMVQDCYGEPAQKAIQEGLPLVEQVAQQTLAKPFANCDVQQRMQVLSQVAQSANPLGKSFVDLVKGLTIQGFRNSEYYQVNVVKFNMAPGYYHGCVSLPK